MTEEEKALIDLLSKYPDGARRQHMPLATRKNDRARQKLRRAGAIVYEDRGKGARWFLVESKEPGE